MILHEYENKLLSNNVIALLDLSAPLVLGGLPLTSWSLTSGECPSRRPWQGRLRSPRLFCGLRFGRKASEEQKSTRGGCCCAAVRRIQVQVLREKSLSEQ